MSRQISYVSQISDLNPAGKPILFWDTCALLDIIRIPERKRHEDFEGYIQINDLIKDGDIISFTSECVIQEYNDHIAQAETVLQSHQNNFGKFGKIHTSQQPDESKIRLEGALTEIDVPPILSGLVNEILDNTIEIRKENQFRDRADDRIWAKKAPAAKKAEYKDCYIWETFHAVARQFPGVNGNRQKIIFFTTNLDDYMVENRKVSAKIHPDIESECQHTGTDIALSINDVNRILSGH